MLSKPFGTGFPKGSFI